MKDDNKLIKKPFILPDFRNQKEVFSFLQQPSIALAEFLTGILSSEAPEFKLSAGRLIQATVKNQFLTQLGQEIKNYRDKGKIKEDFFSSNKNKATLLELLQYIDGETVDEDLLNALKSIFFNVASIEADEKKEKVGYQLFQLCKKLNSIDILILKTCYNIYLGNIAGVNTAINSFGEWVKVISDQIGYDLPELVSTEDDKLVELGLLTSRSYSDKSGIRTGKEFRLTSLAIKLCEFITGWDD